MRKKIGKRIGPVPIALVAVFALAAFISAGFWLAPNGAQAQGLPELMDNETTKCEIVVAENADNDSTGILVGGPGESLKDGGCNFSGEEAVVTFVNKDTNTKAYVAAYVTGGDQFAQMQATEDDGTPLGAEGVDEYLLEIDSSSSGAGGIPSHGKASITVSRSMAKSGEVYVFAYATSAETKTFDDGMVADNGSRLIGIPISLLVSDSTSAGKRKFDGIALVSTAKELDEAADDVDTAANGQGLFYPGATINGTVIPQEEKTPLPDELASAVTRLTALLATPIATADGVLSETDAATILFLLTGDSAYIGADPSEEEDDHTNTPRLRADRDGGVLAVFEKYIADMEGVSMEGATATPAIKTAFDDSIAKAKAALAAAKATVAATGDGDPQNFTNYTAEVAVLVKFQDPAVEKVDEETVSMVEPGQVNTNGVSVITVRIRDKNEVGLSGFLTLTIDPDAGADVVFTESNLKTHRVELSGGGLKEEQKATIEGLPKRGPVRVKVTANFNNGELVLEGYAYREGNADMVTVMTYVCLESSDEAEADEPSACDEEMAASADETKFKLATSKLTEGTVFGPGEQFLVVSTVADAAGNKLADAVSTKEKRAEGVTSDTLIFDPPTMLKKESRTVGMVVDVDDVAGSYDIEVASGSAKMTANVTVSDVASIIMVSCVPEMIPTASGQTDCTVTVTDDGGNIPSNLHEDKKPNGDDRDTIQVTVRSRDAQIIGVGTENRTDIDEEGMATFSILLREDAVEGSSITVNVSTSEIGDATLRESATVTYGDPPTEPGMPMNVMAEATSHDMITVSWESPAADGGSDITGYMVQSAYMMADDMMSDWMDVDPAHMGMDKMYMDSGLMAETTYYYRVVAMNSDGMGEYSDGMAMAMTMMMPPMELGDPSITNVMSDADGMATVMLMPGDNATKHWAWAEPTDGSEGMWHGDSAFAGDATMVTFSGLTSGMNYWFIAIAGRGTGTDSEWSAWSGWTAEKSIQ